jgi:uncharacterized protein YbjT (DUF2867 family)
MTQSIVVTGATGNVASQMIPLLTSAGVSVRAVVRDASKARALAARGVAVVEADLDRPRTLRHIFDGASAAMIITPPGPRAPQQASSALWAARQSGIKSVVRLSAVGAAHDAPTEGSRLHALSDRELENSGISFTILKAGPFMQSLLKWAREVAEQGTFHTVGDGRRSMIDVVDIAAVAARVLTTPGHENKTYTLTGPRSISMHEVAAAFSEVLGKPVQYVPVSVEAADQQMAGWGMDEFMRTMVTDYSVAFSNNWADFVTEDVAQILGRPARSITEFVRANAPAFGKSLN